MTIGLKDVFVYADGEYHKLEHIDSIELEAEDDLPPEDIRSICPMVQTFEISLGTFSWNQLRRMFETGANNWRRYHGMKPHRWRTLERIAKKRGRV